MLAYSIEMDKKRQNDGKKTCLCIELISRAARKNKQIQLVLSNSWANDSCESIRLSESTTNCASPFYEEMTHMSRFSVVNQKCTVQLRLWDGYFLINQKHTVQQRSSPIHEQTNLKSRIS